ncbi:MAG: hypothetical protein FWC03_09275 [Treponema sp.]|nr:hypothetical protein [Treponema sp.]
MINYKKKYKIGFFVIFIFLTCISCTNKKDDLNNKQEISEFTIEIVEEINLKENKYSEIISDDSSNNNVKENDYNDFKIPETYEEALELMKMLQIENVVLEQIIINNEVNTVVEVRESSLTVAGDGIVEAYDIPDLSGNVIFFVANPPPKLSVYVTNIAIVEEPYITNTGNKDHWIKIRMDDGRVGWVKGENAGLDKGGIKYKTRKNIWLDENYSSYWR